MASSQSVSTSFSPTLTSGRVSRSGLAFAATASLWLALRVRRPLTVFLSALIMGVAVNGMHFTGMSAMSVEEHASAVQPSGATGTSLIVPIGFALLFAAVGLGYALIAAPTEEDRAAEAYLAGLRTAGNPGPQQDPGAGSWAYRDRSR